VARACVRRQRRRLPSTSHCDVRRSRRPGRPARRWPSRPRSAPVPGPSHSPVARWTVGGLPGRNSSQNGCCRPQGAILPLQRVNPTTISRSEYTYDASTRSRRCAGWDSHAVEQNDGPGRGFVCMPDGQGAGGSRDWQPRLAQELPATRAGWRRQLRQAAWSSSRRARAGARRGSQPPRAGVAASYLSMTA